MNLFLLQYNGYYNRLVKREEGISAYLPYVVYGPDINDEYLLTEIDNFYEADGIDTKQTVNTPDANFDYLVAVDEYGKIHSRWFVIQAMKLTNGQYELSLHRDLLADYYDDIIAAPSYIERAMVNYGNKLIFNSENSSVNQIKKKEVLLKDESGTGWLVGYVANSFTEDTTINVSESGSAYPVSPIALETLNGYANADTVFVDNYWTIGYKGNVQGFTAVGKYWSIGCGRTTGSYYELSKPTGFESDIQFFSGSGQTVNSTGASLQNLVSAQTTEIEDAMRAYIDTKAEYRRVTDTEYNTLLSMNGGTFISGNTVFTVSVTTPTKESKVYANIDASAGALYAIPQTILVASGTGALVPGTGSSGINAYIALTHLNIVISTVSAPATSVTIRNSGKVLEDAPYRMFAIPLDPVVLSIPNVWYVETANRQFTTKLATEIARSLGSNLYDLQLLPYCPERSILDITNKTNVVTLLGQEGVDYELVRNSEGQPQAFLVWCNKSSFSVNIDHNIDIPANAIDFKIMNETEFVRLTAPNYSASYEFKATMNRGVTGFEANCTYKPFQPYIEVNPKYNSHTIGSLYGGDFNDQRGLVCSGDFSIAVVNDAWIQYQINNKSYADAFDRQVANMTNTYSIQREQQRIAGKINAVTAGISGMASGAMVGGVIHPAAAVAGLPLGIAAGLLSNYGAQKDLEYADKLQAEARSYVEDQYQLSLRNIQALPYSLGKISAFTINNKIFPFLEFYSCSDEEKEAMRNRIKYTSMTVGAIGTIKEYLQAEPAFIQAQLIRLESIPSDYHLITAIAAELHKGIYI